MEKVKKILNILLYGIVALVFIKAFALMGMEDRLWLRSPCWPWFACGLIGVGILYALNNNNRRPFTPVSKLGKLWNGSLLMSLVAVLFVTPSSYMYFWVHHSHFTYKLLHYAAAISGLSLVISICLTVAILMEKCLAIFMEKSLSERK